VPGCATGNVFHPPISRLCRTWMALASCPVRMCSLAPW
jgi:hypothetical protein